MKVLNRIKSNNTFNTVVKHPYFGFIIASVLLLLGLILYSAGMPGFGISTIRAIGQTVIYFIVALGFTLLLGYSGLSSLGTAGFVGLGTYVFGHFSNKLNVPPLISLLISVVFAIVLGTVVGIISLRIEGLYLAIITLGLSEILNEIFKNADSITNGVNGLGIRRPKLLGFLTISTELAYVLLVVAMLFAMIFTINLIKSPTGRALLSMKNSQSAAQSMGINILKYRLLAFVLTTIFAVIGGGLYMMFYRFSITDTWNLSLSLNILAAVIVGGAKSIWGVFLGTFVIFGLDLAVLKKIQFFNDYPNASLIFNGALIIIIVMFYPGGLIRMLYDLREFTKKTYIKVKQIIRRDRYGEDKRYLQSKEEFIEQQSQKIK